MKLSQGMKLRVRKMGKQQQGKTIATTIVELGDS